LESLTDVSVVPSSLADGSVEDGGDESVGSFESVEVGSVETVSLALTVTDSRRSCLDAFVFDDAKARAWTW